MSSKKTLNAPNLMALGVDRLAELLIEISAGNAAAKRRLRLELAGAQSVGELAAEVRKRLITISRTRTFVDWQNRKHLIDDLETQRRTIVERVAKSDPPEALELLWRFLDLAKSVFERCDDNSGSVIGIFRTACSNLGDVARSASTDPKGLANQAFQALIRNDYSQYDGLIAALALALGKEGLEHLKQLITALAAEPVRRRINKERDVVGWASTGPIYSDSLAERSRMSVVRLALQDIADAQGDVDGYIAQYDERTKRVPQIAAKIAERLLTVGRAKEALQTLESAVHRQSDWPEFEWEDVRIDVLCALGRNEETQAARWSCFNRHLSAPHLRAYLKQLADFVDIEVEARGLDQVEQHKNLLQAILFLVNWPAMDRAARLVTLRADELDGDHYEVLTPAAEALAGKYPLAATLTLRAMIDFTLTRSKSSRYRHGARHLMECATLASAIQDFGKFETHDAYVSRLRREHGRKTSLWNLIAE